MLRSHRNTHKKQKVSKDKPQTSIANVTGDMKSEEVGEIEGTIEEEYLNEQENITTIEVQTEDVLIRIPE